jgi:hypothetical protein
MGGLTIVSTWLSEAVVEEQTSVILVIFKVLFSFSREHIHVLLCCTDSELILLVQVFLHLPLHKASPDHMSVLLPTINRLRFYRTQGMWYVVPARLLYFVHLFIIFLASESSCIIAFWEFSLLEKMMLMQTHI